MLTRNAIEYTISCILAISYPNIGKYSVEGTFVNIEGKDIYFHILNSQDQESLLSGNFKMEKISSFDQKLEVPIALESGKPFAEIKGNKLWVIADIITLSFMLLSRFEETYTNRRDEYGRYSYNDSLAKKYNFIHIPIVDEYALLLRGYLKDFIPGAYVLRNIPQLIPTHDIDNVRRFKSFRRVVKSIIGGDLLLRKSFTIAIDSLKQYFQCWNKPDRDPEIVACNQLLKLSDEFNLVSEFYFMGCEKLDQDYRYDINTPTVCNLIEHISAHNMVVGFHGGMGSCNDIELFKAQKKRVEYCSKINIRAGRQHYLCFDVNKSPRLWEKSGIKYDSTLGYYDHEGFMCGTCHEYPLYDIDKDCKLSVKERPLIFMDQTAFSYRRLTKNETLEILFKLYYRTRAVEGNFVLLWHNSSLNRELSSWYEEVYKPFINIAGELQSKRNELIENNKFK